MSFRRNPSEGSFRSSQNQFLRNTLGKPFLLVEVVLSEGVFGRLLPKETSEGPFQVQIFRGITIVPHSLFCCLQQQNEEYAMRDTFSKFPSEVSFRSILLSPRRFAFRISAINRTHHFGNFTRPCIFPVDHFLSAEISFRRENLPKCSLFEVLFPVSSANF